MSQRSIRVNELVKREISDLLHTVYKDEAVYITITDVSVAPDLRNAHIYFSVIGEADRVISAKKFLEKKKAILRKQVGQKIVLKYLPHFKFFHDDSLQRGNHLIELLDELEEGTDHSEASS